MPSNIYPMTHLAAHPMTTPVVNPHRLSRARRSQGGFTLMEVLVSLVIFAIGMLGAAGLQAWSVKAGRQSANLITANNLARNYAEIMQTMPATIDLATNVSGTSRFVISLDSAGIAALASGSAATCQGAASNCTPSDLGDAMIRDWLKHANASLPKFRVVVCRDTAPVEQAGADAGKYRWGCGTEGGDTVIIKLGWAESGDKTVTGEELQQATVNERPRTILSVFGNNRDTFGS